MVPLPNDLWVRSPRKPEFGICFDEGDHLFLWIVREDGDTWIGERKLKREEMWQYLKYPELAAFKKILAKRLERL
jgi:hypothetical protein